MSRNARSCENGEFGEHLPKSLTKANELARRALSKAANVAKARMWRKWQIWRTFAKEFVESK